jgi:hypothetical protein
MPRLPVSGLDVAWRAPDGADQMALLDAPGEPVAAGLALVARLAGPGDWAALSVTDFDFLLLRMQAARLGDELALGFACPSCRSRVEVAISITSFLAGVRSRLPQGVAPDPARPGWFIGDGCGFRLPSAADQAAVAGRANAARMLAERCLDPPSRRGAARAKAERAMEAMAPPVSRQISGVCPECRSQILAPLHVARIVVAAWRHEAATIPDDVDLIARAYHWPEAAILALPEARRRAYADRVRRRLEAA